MGSGLAAGSGSALFCSDASRFPGAGGTSAPGSSPARLPPRHGAGAGHLPFTLASTLCRRLWPRIPASAMAQKFSSQGSVLIQCCYRSS